MLKRLRPNMEWALTQLSHAQLHKSPQGIVIVMHVLVYHKTGFPTSSQHFLLCVYRAPSFLKYFPHLFQLPNTSHNTLLSNLVQETAHYSLL
jgi:hypothetical protein